MVIGPAWTRGVDEHGYREDQVLEPLPPDQVQGRRLTFKELETNQDEKAITN